MIQFVPHLIIISFVLKNVVISMKPGMITFSLFNTLKQLLESYSFILASKKTSLASPSFQELTSPKRTRESNLVVIGGQKTPLRA